MGYHLRQCHPSDVLSAQASALRFLSGQAYGRQGDLPLAAAVYGLGLVDGRAALLMESYSPAVGSGDLGDVLIGNALLASGGQPLEIEAESLPFPEFSLAAVGRLADLMSLGYQFDSLQIGINDMGYPIIVGGVMRAPEPPAEYGPIDGLVEACRRSGAALWDISFSHMTGQYPVSDQASDIESYIGSVLPGSVRLGSGSDGIVFRIAGGLALKVYYDEFAAPDLECGRHARSVIEIAAMRALSGEEGAGIVPEVLASGRIGPFMAMVRHDIHDVPFPRAGIDRDALMNDVTGLAAMLSRPDTLFPNGYPEMTDGQVQDELRTILGHHTTDAFQRQEHESNPLLSVSFVRRLAGLYAVARDRDILPYDIARPDNYGIDDGGHVMLRDLSRFAVRDPSIGVERDIIAEVAVLACTGGNRALAFPVTEPSAMIDETTIRKPKPMEPAP